MIYDRKCKMSCTSAHKVCLDVSLRKNIFLKIRKYQIPYKCQVKLESIGSVTYGTILCGAGPQFDVDVGKKKVCHTKIFTKYKFFRCIMQTTREYLCVRKNARHLVFVNESLPK